MNPVKALENHGQSVWLDFLARGFIAKGELKQLIDNDGVKRVVGKGELLSVAAVDTRGPIARSRAVAYRQRHCPN